MVDMSILTSPMRQERELEADGPIRTGKPFHEMCFLLPSTSLIRKMGRRDIYARDVSIMGLNW